MSSTKTLNRRAPMQNYQYERAATVAALHSKREKILKEVIERIIGEPYNLLDVADRGYFLVVPPVVGEPQVPEVFFFDDKPVIRFIGPYYDYENGAIFARLYWEVLV